MDTADHISEQIVELYQAGSVALRDFFGYFVPGVTLLCFLLTSTYITFGESWSIAKMHYVDAPIAAFLVLGIFAIIVAHLLGHILNALGYWLRDGCVRLLATLRLPSLSPLARELITWQEECRKATDELQAIKRLQSMRQFSHSTALDAWLWLKKPRLLARYVERQYVLYLTRQGYWALLLLFSPLCLAFAIFSPPKAQLLLVGSALASIVLSALMLRSMLVAYIDYYQRLLCGYYMCRHEETCDSQE